MASLPDINPILRAAQSTSTLVDTDTAAIIKATDTQAELANNEADAQIAIGANNIIIKNAQNAGALAAQQARLKAGAIFGADLNQQGEQISATTDIWQQAYQEKMRSLAEIRRKDSVGFMDNPLGYIINQFSVNDDIRRHNTALEIEQAAKQHIDEINSMSNATAVNQKNFEVSITQASIDAEADNLAKAATINADKAKIAGLGYNIEGLKAAINASKEQTALKFQVLGAQHAQESLRLAMDNYALHKQEFEWRKEEKAKAGEADEFFIDRIQEGLKVMYGDKAPDLVANPKLARQYLTLLKSNSPAGKEAVDAYLAGQSGVLGGNPAQVIDSLQSNIKFQFTPAQKPIKDIFEQATQMVQAENANMPGSVTKENYKDKLNTAVMSLVKKQQELVEPGANNVFNIGSLSTVASMPGVNNLPVVTKVLAPAITAGATFDDPKQVYATIMTAVQNKQVTLAEAADGITALYQKGVTTNMQTRQLTKFGIPVGDTVPYNVRIETKPGNLFGSSETVDLTNKAAVTRAMMKTMTMQYMQDVNPSGWVK